MPNRRETLLGLAFMLGGSTALASCDTGAGEDEILAAIRAGGRARFFKRGEFKLLGVIADAIIPATDTPGALDAGVPISIDGMMRVWASDETKRAHRDGLGRMRARLNEIGDGDVLKLPIEERRAAVATLDGEAFGAHEEGSAGAQLASDYRRLKSLIASVYYASEPGATQELQYALVPGEWVADAPLADIGRTWAE